MQMQTNIKSVHQTTDHGCCLFPRFNGHIYPITHSHPIDKNNEKHEIEQKRQIEAYIFVKLEEYSREKSTNLFHLTSLKHIRRRLKRDIKYFSKQQFQPNSYISEEKILEWIDETLERINSHFPHIQSMIDSQKKLKDLFLNEQIFSSENFNNQWQQLQIKRAKILFPEINYNDKEILLYYQKYIIDKLTPKKLENDCLNLKNKQFIDLDEQYQKAEFIGREYLTKLLNDYKKRQYPDINLLKEMIHLGMEQMVKRPKTEEFHKASRSSNILYKALVILKSKNAYSMSLKNIADDFMFLRFGRSLDTQYNKKDSITERFKLLIHMFLNTLSILIHSIKSNTNEISPSFFTQLNSDYSSDNILCPIVYIDQWTWLIEKWKIALQTFPINLTKHGAFGRLVRTTIGVGIARLYGFAENNEQEDLDAKFFQSLQMGYYYGIAYALVDGLQDNYHEKQQIDIDKWLIEMEKILCGQKLDQNLLPQLPITSLLLETFHSLAQLTSLNGIAEQTFTDLALLLRSQRSDKKDLEKLYHNDIDLYIGPLMKSHFTYTSTAFMGGTQMFNDHQRFWTMPFLGQLTDDCRDFDEDRQEKSVTPVTYYAQHYESILNPFFVFLFVCEDLYNESYKDKNTGAFLGRRILRTLRALNNHFQEFLSIFTSKTSPDLYRYILSLGDLFDRVSDPEKSIFRSVNYFANNYSLNHRKIETFAYDCLPFIEKELAIKTNDNNNNPLIHGINYSLQAGGKRLRPLLLFMIAQIYQIDIERILPLARAIEYLHTSSLIFDDLPAQDNAPLRRGQPTLHMTIENDSDNNIPATLTEGRAQLVGIDLIAYAIQLVDIDLQQQGFSYESINRVTIEISQSMNELCQGQFLDLQAARTKKQLTINELDRIAHLKTGKAIEIVLICPVILAQQDKSNEKIIERLRLVGQLMGILFQMKDDLLDVEGNIHQIGKLTNIDQQNQTITYVSLLGIEQTRKRIQRKRKQADLILDEIWPQAGTIRDLIRYICERDK